MQLSGLFISYLGLDFLKSHSTLEWSAFRQAPHESWTSPVETHYNKTDSKKAVSPSERGLQVTDYMWTNFKKVLVIIQLILHF